MKTLRNLFIAMVGLFCLTNSIHAQSYGNTSLTPLAGPILANTTSNTTAVLDIRRNTEFTSLYFKGYPSGVNAATITFTFKPSLDGITFVDQPKFTWAVTFAASTNICQFATNFSTQCYGYLKLDTIALSNNTDSFTMQDFQYGIKNVAR